MLRSMLLGFAVMALATSAVLADDVWIDVEFPDFSVQQAVHQEAEPFKGYAYVTVTNTGTEPWGDFHFEIYSSDGSDVSNVHFLDASLGGVDPTSTQSPLAWAIDNDVVGATMDLYYYDDPILPGNLATFTIYTDNTTDQVPFFGLMMHPTPVPEPAAALLLGLGGLLLIRRR